MTHYLVYMTASDKTEADRLCKAAVSERLAACANILPAITSTYWWEGELQNSTETPCLLKTTAELYPELEARLRELHSYETPCIIALQIADGLPAFLNWIDQETK